MGVRYVCDQCGNEVPSGTTYDLVTYSRSQHGYGHWSFCGPVCLTVWLAK